MRLPARGGVLGAAGKAERLSLRVALRVQLRALSGDRAKLGRVARLERGQQLRDVVLLLLELGDPLVDGRAHPAGRRDRADLCERVLGRVGQRGQPADAGRGALRKRPDAVVVRRAELVDAGAIRRWSDSRARARAGARATTTCQCHRQRRGERHPPRAHDGGAASSLRIAAIPVAAAASAVAVTSSVARFGSSPARPASTPAAASARSQATPIRSHCWRSAPRLELRPKPRATSRTPNRRPRYGACGLPSGSRPNRRAESLGAIQAPTPIAVRTATSCCTSCSFTLLAPYRLPGPPCGFGPAPRRRP